MTIRLPLRRAGVPLTRSTLSLLVLALAASGCAGVDENEPSDSEVDQSQNAILNGATESNVYSGDIALEYWNPTIQKYKAFCSGVLMKNGVALTAKHCIDDLAAAGFWPPYARMGSQRKEVTSYVPHPTLDVAVIRFSPMLMWNWNISGFDGLPTVNTTGYTRVLYTGTNESLNGALMTCRGFGPGGVAAALTTGTFSASYNTDMQQPFDMPHLGKHTDYTIKKGDSGMGCYYVTFGQSPAGYQRPVAYIQSGNMGSEFAYGTGAASFRSWFGY